MALDYYLGDVNGSRNSILHWLRLDKWSCENAALLFVDIDPDSLSQGISRFDFRDIATLDGSCYLFEDKQDRHFLNILERKFSFISIWMGYPADHLETPHCWIELALAKKIPIPWLHIAIEHGFYGKPNQLQEVEDKSRTSFLKVSNMVQWVGVIEVFSIAENSTIAEAANFISDELVKFKVADFYQYIDGIFTLIPEENNPQDFERTDSVTELFNSHYFRRFLNETNEEMESRAWTAKSYYSHPDHVINFAKSIAHDAPNGAKAMIDFISLQLNAVPSPVNIKEKNRASFLSANNMVKLLNLIEAFKIGENAKPNEAADHIVTLLLENEDVKIYRISGAIPDLLNSQERSNAIYEIFNSRYWDEHPPEIEAFNNKHNNPLRASLEDVLMLAGRMVAETPKGAAEIIKRMKDPIFRNNDLQHITKNKVAKANIEQSPISDNTYSTDFIDILNLTVTEFFNPRKNVDPKKEAVTEWIKAKGKELNISVSDNVADTIFTIIKPNDHNPKIKRA